MPKLKPSHHRPRGYANSNTGIVIGNFPWYEMVWRSLRGDFKPLVEPVGGYDAFARQWSVPVDHARIAVRQRDPVVTWLGHVTLLLQVGGLNILLDPTLAEFAGPYGRYGAPRRVPAPLQPRELPPIDAVLISHNHFDHLCEATIQALLAAGQRPRFFVPLGLKAWFDARNIPQVTELDWWDQIDLPLSPEQPAPRDKLRLHFTPSQHWSRRTPFDTNASLWVAIWWNGLRGMPRPGASCSPETPATALTSSAFANALAQLIFWPCPLVLTCRAIS